MKCGQSWAWGPGLRACRESVRWVMAWRSSGPTVDGALSLDMALRWTAWNDYHRCARPSTPAMWRLQQEFNLMKSANCERGWVRHNFLWVLKDRHTRIDFAVPRQSRWLVVRIPYSGHPSEWQLLDIMSSANSRESRHTVAASFPIRSSNRLRLAYVHRL